MYNSYGARLSIRHISHASVNTPKRGERNKNVNYAVINLKPKQVVIKDGARGIILLELTTNRHEASRGLSATAELLVDE